MANREDNYLATSDALGNLLDAFGISPIDVALGRPSPTIVDRVWLPRVPGVIEHPSSLGCYQEIPRDPLAAVRVECGKAFNLTLDTEWTTPQAILGIKFAGPPSSRTDCVIMCPGDSIDVPSGFDHFWVFASDQLTGIRSDFPTVYGIVGYVSFLVGRSLGAKPHCNQVHPLARVLAIRASDGVSEANQAAFVANGKFQFVKVNAFSQDPGFPPLKGTGGFSCLLKTAGWTRANFDAANVAEFAKEAPIQGLDLPPLLVPEFDYYYYGDEVVVSGIYDSNLTQGLGIGTLPITPFCPVNMVEAWFTTNQTTLDVLPAPTLILEATDTFARRSRETLVFHTFPVGAPAIVGALPVTGFDQILFEIRAVGAALAANRAITIYTIDESVTIRVFATGVLNTGASNFVFAIGPGCAYNTNTTIGPIQIPPPTIISLEIAAPGAGIAWLVRVIGCRNSPSK